MARRKRIPYDPPARRGAGKGKAKGRRPIPRADQLFMSRRMFLARGAVVGAFSVLAGRLGFMQLHEGERFQVAAVNNQRRYVIENPTRGMVFDRAGRELAVNTRAWEVRINPDTLPTTDTPAGAAARARVLDHLINALNLPDALVLDQNGVPRGNEPMVYAKTAQLLGKATLGVEETDRTARQEGVLRPTGQVLLVNGRELHVYAYASQAERAADAARIGPDGNLLDGTLVAWGDQQPHFFAVGNLLCVLLCEDPTLTDSVKRAIARLLPLKQGALTASSIAAELRRAGLASWTEYIATEARYNTLVRLEDELTTDQAALFRANIHELPGVRVINQIEYRIANTPPGRTVVVKTGVPREVALKLEANSRSLPGVELDGDVLVRRYPGGESMSHILGYAGKISAAERDAPDNLNDAGNKLYEPDDTIGKDGLERVMERKLRGERGGRIVNMDGTGAEVGTISSVAPTPGQNVSLTIDLEFQRAVSEILRLGIEFSNADRRASPKPPTKESGAGCVVAIDPRSGEVLAMVSYPHYDNQLFVDGISTRKFKEYISKERNQPLLDRALRGAYPPGSTLKPFLAAAALQEGTIRPETSYTCRGALQVPFAWTETQGQIHPCWNREGHGGLEVLTAIEQSCDVFFYNVGAPKQPIDENNPNSDFLHYRDLSLATGLEDKHYFEGLGIERIKKQLQREFWFGQKTGIELPTEEPGVVPDPVWLAEADPLANWSVSATINVSIGQGYFLTTPLQLALNTAALANRGVVHKPRLVREIADGARTLVEPSKPEVLRTLGIKPEHLATARDGMRRVVVNPEGTAYASVSGQKKWPMTNPEDQPEIPIAGKTGTAEVGVQNTVTLAYESQHAWFTCFGPFEGAEIALAVIVEDGGEGATYAVPVADRVMRAYFELTGKRPRGLVLRPDGATLPLGQSVLAEGAAFPEPGATGVEIVD